MIIELGGYHLHNETTMPDRLTNRERLVVTDPAGRLHLPFIASRSTGALDTVVIDDHFPSPSLISREDIIAELRTRKIGPEVARKIVALLLRAGIDLY